MRLLKEKFTEPEMMKQANRRGFSVETGEYGDDAMGMTLGMLEKSKDGLMSGNIRRGRWGIRGRCGRQIPRRRGRGLSR